VNTTITIDKAGRLVLPKAIRELLRIGAGDQLEVQTHDDCVLLSPVRVRPGLQKEQGIWVYGTGKPVDISILDVIDHVRNERAEEVLGVRE